MADPAPSAPDEVDVDQTIEEALDSLPPDPREFMSNVAIVVEEEPPPGVPLLGLYQGFPLTTRGRAYAGVPPDKITIYRRPLERRYAADPARLRREIRRVVYTRWRTTSASATSVSSRSVATNSCSARARSALSPLVVPQILGRERLAAAFWALPRR